MFENRNLKMTASTILVEARTSSSNPSLSHTDGKVTEKVWRVSVFARTENAWRSDRNYWITEREGRKSSKPSYQFHLCTRKCSGVASDVKQFTNIDAFWHSRNVEFKYTAHHIPSKKREYQRKGPRELCICLIFSGVIPFSRIFYLKRRRPERWSKKTHE